MSYDPSDNCNLCCKTCTNTLSETRIRDEMIRIINIRPKFAPALNDLGRVLFGEWNPIYPKKTCAFQNNDLDCTFIHSSFKGNECPFKGSRGCPWKSNPNNPILDPDCGA